MEAQEAIRARGQERHSDRRIYVHWAKRHSTSCLSSGQKAPLSSLPPFQGCMQAKWGDEIDTKVLSNPFDTLLAGTWVLPLNTNTLFGSLLPAVNQVHQMDPGCLHRPIVHARFLTPTSMATATYLKLLCLLFFGWPSFSLRPPMTAWPNQEVPSVLLVLSNQFPYYPSAQGRPMWKTHFFQTTLLTCSKKAWKIALCKKSEGGRGLLRGLKRGRMEGQHWSKAFPWAGRQNLRCMVMVRMLTALRALCLWKGSPRSSEMSTDRFWDSRLVCSRRCGWNRGHGGLSEGRSCPSSKLHNYRVSVHTQQRCSTFYKGWLVSTSWHYKCSVFVFHV